MHGVIYLPRWQDEDGRNRRSVSALSMCTGAVSDSPILHRVRVSLSPSERTTRANARDEVKRPRPHEFRALTPAPLPEGEGSGAHHGPERPPTVIRGESASNVLPLSLRERGWGEGVGFCGAWRPEASPAYMRAANEVARPGECSGANARLVRSRCCSEFRSSSVIQGTS